MNKVAAVYNIVFEAFEGKKDKAGKPYINHLLRVSDTVSGWCKQMSNSDEDDLVAAALLHDIVEDCEDWDFERVKDWFGYRIAFIIRVLTKGIQNYDVYIAYVTTDPSASLIKLADLKDNMDLTRLETITEKDIERTKKYHAAYQRILKAWPEYKKIVE